jgi:DNA-binding CsgD family transcriptional regulator
MNTAKLTAHEIKIVDLLAQGLSHMEIGRLLKCSHKTIGGHVCRAIKKYGCLNGTHLVAECLRKGVIK